MVTVLKTVGERFYNWRGRNRFGVEDAAEYPNKVRYI